MVASLGASFIATSLEVEDAWAAAAGRETATGLEFLTKSIAVLDSMVAAAGLQSAKRSIAVLESLVAAAGDEAVRALVVSFEAEEGLVAGFESAGGLVAVLKSLVAAAGDEVAGVILLLGVDGIFGAFVNVLAAAA